MLAPQKLNWSPTLRDWDDFDVDEDDDEVMRQRLALVEAHAHLFNQA